MHRLYLLLPIAIVATSPIQATSPSLAKRPVEHRDLSEPVRQILPPAPADASLRAQIESLVSRADASQRAFAALVPKAEAAASSAGADRSEGWIAAQQLLSALEAGRAGTVEALAELDSTTASRLDAGQEAGMAELQAADAQVSAMVDDQQRVLDRLRSRLSR